MLGCVLSLGLLSLGCDGAPSKVEVPAVFVDDAGAKSCPESPGSPAMIAVGGWDGHAYCIDTTEVTNAHYAAWLETSPDVANQRAGCEGNATFVPTTGMPAKNDYPVASVDFCDAVAFCAAFGKRLCGRVGGGPSLFYGDDDPSESQWFSACTHGGATAFPYGAAYDANACNGKDALYGAVLTVGVLPGCVSGTTGIVDMSGNVWEWEDACIPGDAGVPVCRRRGGSFLELGEVPPLRRPELAPARRRRGQHRIPLLRGLTTKQPTHVDEDDHDEPEPHLPIDFRGSLRRGRGPGAAEDGRRNEARSQSRGLRNAGYPSRGTGGRANAGVTKKRRRGAPGNS